MWNEKNPVCKVDFSKLGLLEPFINPALRQMLLAQMKTPGGSPVPSEFVLRSSAKLSQTTSGTLGTKSTFTPPSKGLLSAYDET